MNATHELARVATMSVLFFTVLGCSGGQVVIEGDGSDTSIFVAAAKGNIVKMKELISADPSLVDAYGPEGKAPLHDAAAAGQNAAVKFLLEQGADPAVTDESGNTAVNTAFAMHHPDTAKIIQDAIAAKGNTPPK